jgi:hypothetical protein
MSGDCVPSKRVNPSPGRLLLVCGPAYSIYALAEVASWQLRSAPSVVAVALLATVLPPVVFGGYSFISAQGDRDHLQGPPQARRGSLAQGSRQARERCRVGKDARLRLQWRRNYFDLKNPSLQ